MAAEASEGSAAPPSPASTSAKTITDRNLKKRASPDDDSEAPQKVTKRRAARACVSCRARKVRCDVVEGAPCGNCRWDNVEVGAGSSGSCWPAFNFVTVTDLNSALFKKAADESEWIKSLPAFICRFSTEPLAAPFRLAAAPEKIASYNAAAALNQNSN